MYIIIIYNNIIIYIIILYSKWNEQYAQLYPVDSDISLIIKIIIIVYNYIRIL